jgi:hypothetical protein
MKDERETARNNSYRGKMGRLPNEQQALGFEVGTNNHEVAVLPWMS